MIEDGLFTASRNPAHALAFHDSASLRPARSATRREPPSRMSTRRYHREGRWRAWCGSTKHARSDRARRRIVGTLQTLVSRELDPQDAAVVTVGLPVRSQAQRHLGPGDLLLTVRSYNEKTGRPCWTALPASPAARRSRRRPEDRMPEVVVHAASSRRQRSTRTTDDVHRRASDARFGAERVRTVPPPMVGEDFGRYHLPTQDRKPDLRGSAAYPRRSGARWAGTIQAPRSTVLLGPGCGAHPSPPRTGDGPAALGVAEEVGRCKPRPGLGVTQPVTPNGIQLAMRSCRDAAGGGFRGRGAVLPFARRCVR
jgi:metal-dependent amidase/aminoacylase/carboxypeptidase family protein